MFTSKFASALALIFLAFGISAAPDHAASRVAAAQDQGSAASVPAPLPDAVPAYHAQPPVGPLPATLSPSLFSEPLVQNAYLLASRVKRILYQQPCYCHCDRYQGHASLLDCFAGHHAAECGVCIREGLYAYEQSRNGKTAKQIREGIEQGQWKQLDTSKYQAPLSNK